MDFATQMMFKTIQDEADKQERERSIAIAKNLSDKDRKKILIDIIFESYWGFPLPLPPAEAKSTPEDGVPLELDVTFDADCVGARAVAMPASGKFIYVANGDICAYKLNGETGVATAIAGMPFRGGTFTRSIALDRSGAYLFAANQDSNNVSAFSIDAATGALTQVPGSPFAAGKEPFSVVVDGTGRYVYVANRGGDSVSAYRLDIETGALTPVAGSPFAASVAPWALAADPAGRYLFVASNAAQAYRIDPGTGALAAVGAALAPGGRGIAVDPTGRFVYVTSGSGVASSGGDSGVTAYRVGPTGALAAIGARVPTGNNPIGVAVGPAGTTVFAANLESGDLSGFHADPVTGALTPIAGSPFPVGENPVGVTSIGAMPTNPVATVLGSRVGRPVAVNGGRPPYTFSVPAGTLPPGLALDPVTGYLSGTSTTPGTYVFTVRAADSAGATAERNFTVAVIAASGPAASSAIEFYNGELDHYFITWVADEIAKLDAGTVIKGWTRTGKAIPVYTAAQPATSPVCRYYIPPALGNSHFFGRGTVECNATGQKNPSFVLEDPAFMHMVLPTAGVCPANTINVYRVFSNRPDANHRYTTDQATRDAMVAKGWLAEGDGPELVVMCAPG